MNTSSPVSQRGPHAALLVIDVQQGLFLKSTPIHNAENLLANLCTLIDRAHRAGAPVFFIQHANDRLLAPGTDDWQLHPQLQPADSDMLIQKRHGNAFQDTELESALAARATGTIIVTGLVTHGCVQATCAGGLRLGYRVILVKDGHSHYSKRAEQIIAEWHRKLSAAGIELHSTADVGFETSPIKV